MFFFLFKGTSGYKFGKDLLDVIGKQLQIVGPLKSFTVTQLAEENLEKFCVEKNAEK